MHWLTIITALAYSAAFAFLVFVKGWELSHAAMVIVGMGAGVVLAVLMAIMLMPKVRIPANLITQSGNVITQSDYSEQSAPVRALPTYCGEANTQLRIPQSIPRSQTNL